MTDALAIFDEERRREEDDEAARAARNNLVVESGIDPEMAAAAQRNGGGFAGPGYDPRRLERTRRDELTLSVSPRLQSWMADEANAAVARDDVSALAFWELLPGGAVLRQGADPAAAREALEDAAALEEWGGPLRGLEREFRAGQRDIEMARLSNRLNPQTHQVPGETRPLGLVDLARLRQLEATRRPQPDDIAGTVTRQLPQILGSFDAAGRRAVRDARRNWRQSMDDIETNASPLGKIEATANAPFAGLTGAVSGAGRGFVGFTYEQEAGHAFAEFRQMVDLDGDRLGPNVAGFYARRVGEINAALEFVGLGTTARAVGAGDLLRRLTSSGVRRELRRIGFREAAGRLTLGVGGAALSEGVTELTQEGVTIALGDLAQQAQGGEWEALSDAEIAERLWESFRVGATVGGVLGGVPAGARFASDIEAVRDARTQQEIFEAIADGSQASALRVRAPGRYADAVDTMTAGGPLEDVSIDAERFAAYFQDRDIDPFAIAEQLRGVGAERLQQALDSGGELTMPTGTYAAQIAGGPHDADALRPHIRMGPDLRTPAEVAARLELGVDLERAVEEAERLQAQAREIVSEAEAVRERVRGMFAGADAYTDAANDAFAAYYSEGIVTLAGRAGLKPTELLDIVSLKMQGPFEALRGEGSEGALEQPGEISPAAAQRHWDLLESILEERRKISTPGLRATPPEQIPEVGTREYAEATIEAREARGRGERVTPIQRALLRWEEENAFPDGLFQDEEAGGSGQLDQPPRRRATGPSGAIYMPHLGQGGDLRAATIKLFEGRDLSTPLHEGGHLFLEVLRMLATREGASEQLQRDWQTTLDWFGVSAEQWESFDLNQKRRHHEQWARGIEAHLMTGEAPSLRLRDVFAMFKRWLTWIYKAVTALDVELSPEIRGVMDRLVASDEAIAEARAAQGAAGAAGSGVKVIPREQFGGTDKQYERYTRNIARATEAAASELHARAMEAVVADQTRWWRSEEGKTRRAVEIDIDSELARRAYEWLATGRWRHGASPEGLEPMRISPDAVAENYGPEALDKLPPELIKTDPGVLVEQAREARKVLRSKAPRRLEQAVRQMGGIRPDDPSASDIIAITGRKANAPGSIVADAQYFRAEGGTTRRVPARYLDDIIMALWEDGYFGAGPGRLFSAPPDSMLASMGRRIGPERRSVTAYHYTTNPLEGDFRPGTYFSTNPRYGERAMTDTAQEGAQVHRVDLQIKNPRYVAPDEETRFINGSRSLIEEARVAGHDALILRHPTGLGDEILMLDSVPREALTARAVESDGALASRGSQDAPPWYSAIERALEASTTARAPGAQWLATIRKTPGVKAEELAWIGLEDFLAAQEGPVAREDVLAFVRENGVRVEETVLGEAGLMDIGGIPPQEQRLAQLEERDRLNRERLDTLNRTNEETAAADDARIEEIRARVDELTNTISQWEDALRGGGPNRTRWSQYALPGGESYRELLLRLPDQTHPDAEGFARRRAETQGVEYDRITPGAREVYRQRANESVNFRSSHFDQPNILAHVRFDERVDAEGRRTLFIEELQSDAHQAGRERGYRQKVRPDEVQIIREGFGVDLVGPREGQRLHLGPSYETHTDAYLQEMVAKRWSEEGAVPDMPFKNNAWASLALKRMIRWAAENGFDQIAWTRGRHQIERFDLATHIRELSWKWNGSEVELQADSPLRGPASMFRLREELPEAVGGELAKKINTAIDNGDTAGSYSGLDLQVGGEGMRAFYDKILPNIANDLGKKFGARVGETHIDASGALEPYISGERWLIGNRQRGAGRVDGTPEFKSKEEAQAWIDENPGAEAVHSLPITPQMREAAMEGMPLFSQPQRTARDPFSTVEELQARATEEFGVDWEALSRAGKVEVVQSSADVPAGGYGLPRGVQAVYLRRHDAAYFIANNIRAENLKGLILHEIGVHHGMADMLGERGFRELLRQVDHMVDEEHPEVVRAREWAERYAMQPEHVPEETLAYLIEEKADLPLVQSILSRLRQWLIRTFGATMGMRLTVDDLRALAVTSLRRAAEQARREAGDAEGVELGVFASRTWVDLESMLEERRRGGAEAGGPLFSGERPTIREFLDKLEGDLKNTPAYRLDDEAIVAARQEAEHIKQWFAARGVDIAAKESDLREQVAKIAAREDAEGVDPDLAASIFGFASGEELLAAISSLTPRRQAIEAETRRRMLRAYGDPFADGTVMDEALTAAHREARAKPIELELEAIERAIIGDDASGVRVARPVSRAARDIAEAQIERKSVREIRRFDWFLGNERRHARNAAEAWASGDLPTARTEKHRQLVNFHLYGLARKASEEVDRAQRYFRRFERDGTRDNIDADYLDQIDALLEQYELRKISRKEERRRMSLAAWAQDMENRGLGHMVAIDPRILANARRQSFTTLTLDEVRSLVDAVKNIEHLGRLKDRLLDAADQRAFRETVSDAAAQMDATGPISPETRRNYSPSAIERVQDRMREAHAEMTRMEFLFRYLDGGKANGPIWRALWLPFANAANKEAALMRGATQSMEAIWSRYTNRERTHMFKRRIAMPDLPVGAATHYTKAELLAIALNLGNEGNVRALVDGFGWGAGRRGVDKLSPAEYAAAKQQIVAALSRVLDARDWQTVQRIWDLIGTFRDDAFTLQKDLTGIEPQAVEAAPLALPDGTQLQGGYFPLKFDGTRNRQVAKEDQRQSVQEMFGSNWSRPMTRKGHLIERVGSGGRPVKLSLSVFSEHVQNVVHDIAYRRAVIDADRIIQDSAFADTFVRVAGKPMYDQLRPWLQSIASDRVDPSAFMWKFLQKLRGNVAIAAMGYRISTGLQQLAGLLQAVPHLGAAEMAGALTKLVRNPATIAQKARVIANKSEFMRNRMQTLDRDIRETIERMETTDKLYPIRHNAFALVGMFDWAVSSVVWTAAYDKAMSGNMDGIAAGDEAAAIQYGDQSVRTTQSAGLPQDLPAIMRGNQVNKLLTMFFSYFSVLYNWTAFDQVMGVRKGRIPVHVFTANMALIYIISPLIAEALAGRWEPREDEDEEERNKRLASVVLRFPFATVPVVRDMANAIGTGYEYQLSPAGSAPGKISEALSDVAEGRTFESEATTKRAVTALGYAFGLPTPQAWIPIDYVADKLEGEEEGFDPIEAFVADRR